MLVKRRAAEQLPKEFGSAFLKRLAAQLAAIQLQGVGQGWDAVKIEATVAEFNEGDASAVTPSLLGDFGLSEVQFFAAVTDEAAEVRLRNAWTWWLSFRPTDRAPA